VHGDAKDVHVAGAYLNDEQHLDTTQGHRAVHMEEITRQRGRGLRPVETAAS
jgi:hypothetical protein